MDPNDEGVLLPEIRDFTGDELEELGLEPPDEDVIIVGGPNRDKIEAAIQTAFDGSRQLGAPRGGLTVGEARVLRALDALDRRVSFWEVTNGGVMVVTLVLACASLLA